MINYLLTYYKKYKNNFTQILRLAKINFYENKFQSVSSNSKLTWKFINELTGTIHNNKDKIELINDNGNLINIDSEPIRGANLFNNYFINVGKNLTDHFLGIDNLEQIVNNKTNLTNFDSIFLKNVDVLEVHSIINKWCYSYGL